MNEEEKKNISKMASFCRIVDHEALHRYRLVEPILQTEFYQPEFDILRNEIGRCFVTASYQACITLTNHLLERYCKILLVYTETEFKTIDNVPDLETGFDKANQKYMDKMFSETLKACRSKGLISKDDKKLFDKYREIFRNGYSHADPNKILGNAKGGFFFGSFDGKTKSEFKELTYSKIPMFQGLAIETHSKNNALPYFIEVENLIRKSIHNIQPDDFKTKYELVRIVYDDEQRTEP